MVRWQDRAACRGRDDVDWLADVLTPAAAAVCMDCPVRVDCLADALDRESKCDGGIWGGTGVRLRHRVRLGQVSVTEAWAEAAALAAQPVLS